MRKSAITIINQKGLHARAAAKVARVAGGGSSDVYVSVGARKANAKSILELLSLGVALNDTVSLEVKGPDEDHVYERMADLFAARFDEAV